jgi:hypothetical protein
MSAGSPLGAPPPLSPGLPRGHEDHRAAPGHGAHPGHGGHGGHGWMMILCCIPMLVIAIALVASGTVGAGFLVPAIACTVMMVLMMKMMDHGTSG